ncbi:class I SAM-dependent methyltransferase [Virgisporangium aurantiacum]|uniref:Methyltransferase type 11 domain-containing protein n=1 Tax=Virgisporangium aurantiacum TaxID=175570 RepID=A0A8J3ZE42_9ACTN|nr:class I SAM-dependent methyltransferase [Virgisporangium aurantiacum]GIJ62236.1 hypothetical protein Vau01_097520 [Virgisporangium aurantiacum]
MLRWLVPGPVLEVGVGTGLVSAALLTAGRDVIGVDISANMLVHARRRLGFRVVRGDARALPLADESVANVAFVWMLLFVDGAGAALAEAARVLRPDGRVVVIGGRPAGPRTDVDETIAPLDGLRSRRPQDVDAKLPRLAAAARLRPVHQGLTTGYPVETVPEDMARLVEERSASWMSQVDDAVWERTAVPVISALRGLPEPQRPRRYLQRNTLLVFRRP